jgi:hypothetical protein
MLKTNPLKIGKLLCINGAGIQYRWLLNNLDVSSYQEMNALASKVPIGSDGVCLIPFGNGTERVLDNKDLGTRIVNLNLNNHNKSTFMQSSFRRYCFFFCLWYGYFKNQTVLSQQ